MQSEASRPEERFTRFLRALGEGDWNLVTESIAPSIRVDFESLYGLPPVENTPESLATAWRTLVELLDVFQNRTGDAQVHTNEGDVFVAIDTAIVMEVGIHRFIAHGIYESLWQKQSDGQWRMSAIRFNTERVEGEPNILAYAHTQDALSEEILLEESQVHITGQEQWPVRLYSPRKPARHQSPGVIVVGSSDPLRAQTGAIYARRLAAAGAHVMTFDVKTTNPHVRSNFHVESFEAVAPVIQASADRLLSDSNLAVSRLALVGIAFGSAFALRHAAIDPRIGHLILVAPWWYQKHELDALYQRARYHLDGDDDAAESAHQSRKALVEWRAFKPLQLARNIDQPTLIIASREGSTPANVERLYSALQCYRNLIWVPGAQHYFAAVESTIKEVTEHIVDELELGY